MPQISCMKMDAVATRLIFFHLIQNATYQIGLWESVGLPGTVSGSTKRF